MNTETTIKEETKSLLHSCVTIDLNAISWYFGYVVKETEKAVQIDMMMDFASPSGAQFKLVYDRACWIPKSMLIDNGNGSFKAKPFFKKIMKPYNIKPYLFEGDKKIFA